MRKGFTMLLPNEAAMAPEIAGMGNIYYLFSWLNERRKYQLFFPDGELKRVMIPMDEFKFPAFSAFINGINGTRFKLISGAKPFNWEFFTETKITYLDADRKVICEKPFPCVRIWVWLKHLKEFIPMAVEAGFIAEKGCKAIKEQRAVIYEGTELGSDLFSPGVPELGFEHFRINI
jgi:hypothetical protein